VLTDLARQGPLLPAIGSNAAIKIKVEKHAPFSAGVEEDEQ